MQELHFAMPIMSLTAIISAGVMTLNWFMYQSADGVKQWMYSMQLMALTCLLLIGISYQPETITFAALICLFATFYFFVSGTEKFFKVTHSPKLWLAIGVVYFGLTIWFSFIDSNRAMRYIASYSLVSIAMGLSIRSLMICTPSQHQRTNLSRWGFLVSCLCVFAVLSIHLLTLDAQPTTAALSNLHTSQVLVIASTVCLPIILCVAFSLLCGAQQLEKMAVLAQKNKQASLLKGRFLTMLSHELRTPLNAIVGHADMLKRIPREPQKHAQLCDVISEAALSLSDLANQVLLQAKGEQVSALLKPTSLAEQAQTVHELLLPLAKNKDLNFKLRVDERLSELYFLTDKESLPLVLKNLVSNAIKYTDYGEVVLSVSMHEQKVQAGDTQQVVRFSVSDTGVGLSKSALDYIFEPFASNQLEHNISNSAGFGLSLSKQLVENLGGELTVNSELSKGTVFTFDLVLSVCEVPERIVDENIVKSPEQLASNRILIVEDNLLNQEVLKHYLQDTKMLCEYVRTLKAASESMADNQFDVILLDMHLPDGHGIEWWQSLQSQLEPAQAPTVIALTGDADEQAQQRYLQQGIAYCLEKPVSGSTLLSVLEHVGTAHTTQINPLKLLDEALIHRLNQQFDSHFLNTKLMYLADTFDYEFAQLQGLADIQAIDQLEIKLQTLIKECVELGLKALALALEETNQAVKAKQVIDWRALHHYAKQNALALQNYQQRVVSGIGN
ncbi:hybrid sensor histidine kinase/response regulator [Pseudoalteromonas sp. MTN2-4]|uniref:ATP-binding response regulator n=1 Tax=Pseudoalteromonas sp. MTN2-4 TaxID=3056555 RepID=UPI0036F2DFDE